MRTEKDIIKSIKKEMKWIDIKEYSHNIVSLLLKELSEYKNEDQMEEFIIKSGLRDLGW
jgi:hypothetical protein